jgi:hypothetical protein
MFYFSFVTDSFFEYKILASIVVAVIACVAIGWGVYFLSKKIAPNLKRSYRIFLAIISVVVGVLLLGIVSEQLGL